MLNRDGNDIKSMSLIIHQIISGAKERQNVLSLRRWKGWGGAPLGHRDQAFPRGCSKQHSPEVISASRALRPEQACNRRRLGTEGS